MFAHWKKRGKVSLFPKHFFFCILLTGYVPNKPVARQKKSSNIAALFGKQMAPFKLLFFFAVLYFII